MTFLAILLGLLSIGGVAFALLSPMMGDEGKVEARLKSISEKQTSGAAKQEKDAARRKQIASALDTGKGKRKSKQSLEARIGQAGLTMTRSQYFLFSAIAGLLAAVMTLIMSGSFFIGVMGGIIGCVGIPSWYLSFNRNKRLNKFSADFAGAIDVIVRGIKAGLPLGDCIRIVGSEAPEPLAGEFRGMVEVQQMGMTVTEAVERLAERIPTPEANFFAIVITIQQKTGGNLSEALGNLSRVLRDRKKMKQKIKAMSTEATASAGIIASLPFIVGTLVYITSPAYISLLWSTSTGNVVMLCAAFWMACGVFVMRKMINFDF